MELIDVLTAPQEVGWQLGLLLQSGKNALVKYFTLNIVGAESHPKASYV